MRYLTLTKVCFLSKTLGLFILISAAPKNNFRFVDDVSTIKSQLVSKNWTLNLIVNADNDTIKSQSEVQLDFDNNFSGTKEEKPSGTSGNYQTKTSFKYELNEVNNEVVISFKDVKTKKGEQSSDLKLVNNKKMNVRYTSNRFRFTESSSTGSKASVHFYFQ